MEKSLKTKYKKLVDALDTLDIAIKQYADIKEEKGVKLSQFSHADLVKALRDSVIKRFEFTIDMFWKYLKAYLKEKHNIAPELPSPRSIVREAGNMELISMQEVTLFLRGLDMRNLSSHIYHEDDAQEIANKIPEYYQLMARIIKNLKP